MTKVVLEFKNCKECPFFDIADTYSTDGFDRMEDWVCTKETPTRKIQGGVEWHEEKHIKIPDWCPIRLENINDK